MHPNALRVSAACSLHAGGLDVFVAWSPGEKIAGKVKPFVDWLAEADEDSS